MFVSITAVVCLHGTGHHVKNKTVLGASDREKALGRQLAVLLQALHDYQYLTVRHKPVEALRGMGADVPQERAAQACR